MNISMWRTIPQMNGSQHRGKHRLKRGMGLEEAAQNDNDRVWHWLLCLIEERLSVSAAPARDPYASPRFLTA